jgi:hypothetical protein
LKQEKSMTETTHTPSPRYPKPDRSNYRRNFSKTPENDSLDIGWNEGTLNEGRPFRLEAWCQDQTTFLTYLFSAVGLEKETAESLTQRLVAEGLFRFIGDNRSVSARIIRDASDQEMWLYTVVVGADDETFIEDNLPLKKYERIEAAETLPHAKPSGQGTANRLSEPPRAESKLAEWCIQSGPDSKTMVCVTETDEPVATVHGNEEETFRRALLIARAPSLRDAVSAMIEVLRTMEKFGAERERLTAQDMLPVLECALHPFGNEQIRIPTRPSDEPETKTADADRAEGEKADNCPIPETLGFRIHRPHGTDRLVMLEELGGSYFVICYKPRQPDKQEPGAAKPTYHSMSETVGKGSEFCRDGYETVWEEKIEVAEAHRIFKVLRQTVLPALSPVNMGCDGTTYV